MTGLEGALPPTLQVSKRRLGEGKGNLPQAWRAGLRAPGKPVLRAHCWKSRHHGCPSYPNCVTSLGAGRVVTGLPSTCWARGLSVHLHAADRSHLPVRGGPRPWLGRGLRGSCRLHPPSANPRPPAEPAAPPPLSPQMRVSSSVSCRDVTFPPLPAPCSSTAGIWCWRQVGGVRGALSPEAVRSQLQSCRAAG